ncbi:FG-GAP repeat protein [Cellulophaga algicola DSM 14237]|uniref:FG-GAP repeat protein n=1 Tax=Cellulophaga algicola (strain DSM 14237 / IC166 / ACAM 630) TaxID=688270 RepID=E6XER0_CELAD|nr:VCBS repeat-containing protein [Cellulophaga algicola]ADV48112.1 FG-GAP repeat protein [Cellulophaga algicola DSM 14237]
MKLSINLFYFLVLFVFLSFFLGCNKNVVTEKTYLLEKLESSETGIDFVNQIDENSEHSIINYLYFYNGGGVSAGDVNNDGLVDLYFVSNMKENKLYINKGNFEFEDVSMKSNTEGKSEWNTGTTMIDINNDGFLDIYVCAVSGLLNFKGRNELFVNNGDGTFTEDAKSYGLDFEGYATQAYFFDYDKDDDLDVYIVNHAVHTTLSHGLASVRNKRVPFVGDVLLNNENGVFKDVSELSGIYGGVNGYGLSAAIADFDNDGWDDIYVCNDFHEDDYYYINNRDGTFRESLGESFSTISRFSMGSDAADVNNDGYLDLITLDMLPYDERVVKESEGEDAMFHMNERLRKLGYKDQFARNMMQINKEGKYFTETALFNGIEATDWSWGPLIADFNNDGFNDLFISNGILRRPNDLDFKIFVSNAFKGRTSDQGLKWLYKSIDSMPSGLVSNEIFEGGLHKFKNKTGSWFKETPTSSNGAAYVDLDNDGNLDLVINNLREEVSIYKNTSGKSNNFISFKFNYKPKNNSGIGTKIKVYAGGVMQFKQLYKSRGFLSSTDDKLHFGLNGNNQVDSVRIIWPNNTYQTLFSPEINKTHDITLSSNSENFVYVNKLKNQLFKPEENILKHSSLEDVYNDFLYEKLIPYKVSSIGPAVAQADIDNNGFDDLFIGGSSGEKAVLYMNTGMALVKTNIKSIELDYLYEDNSAVFFDADNDGDLDLYVASGIHKSGMSSFQNDRLYINNNGSFVKSTGLIPRNHLNTSTVVAADYDNDGDQDLFVGNLSKRGDFGKSVLSYLLVNNGKGRFEVDTEFKLPSHVTAAEWVDFDDNGMLDLVVSVEWDAPKVYLNTNGRLNLLEIPKNMNGLWQSISVFDVDKDGDKDILLGNWGLNTRLSASSNKPLRMYYSDFNSDGKNETVLAYSVKDDYYPINSKDELQNQMNFIRKKFPTYKSFALKNMDEIFGLKSIEKSTIYEIDNLSSGYLENVNNSFDRFIPFSDEIQLGPINSFGEIRVKESNQLVISGNLKRVNNYNGGYYAMKGFLMESLDDYESLSNLGIAPLKKEIRTIKVLNQKNRSLLLIFPNNGEVKVYSYVD